MAAVASRDPSVVKRTRMPSLQKQRGEHAECQQETGFGIQRATNAEEMAASGTVIEVRHILLFGCLLIGSCAFAESPTPPEYRLRFFHTHTGERLDIVYRIGTEYIPESLDRVDH